MSESKSSLTQSTKQISASEVRFVRSSAQSLRTLNSLHEDEMIILFTPALPQTSNSEPSSGTEDPFECLGRAISKRHARVRHVPFVPKVGLTDLHVAWIRKASAIIVVNCDPALLADTKLKDSMTSQAQFSTGVLTAVFDTYGSAQMPLSGIDISASTPNRSADYQNVVVCSSYTKPNMEKVAALLMG